MQQIVSAREHVILCVLPHDFVAGFQRHGHQPRHVLAQLAQVFMDAPLDRIECLAGEVLVQEISGFDQFGRCISPIGQDNAVLHVPVRRDNDQQDAFLGKTQKFDVAECRAPALARHYHARKARQVGEQVRGLGDEFLGVVRLQLPFQLVDLDLIQRPDLEQRIDEKSITAWRWHPARGGVRAGNETDFFQVRHDVADARRA